MWCRIFATLCVFVLLIRRIPYFSIINPDKGGGGDYDSGSPVHRARRASFTHPSEQTTCRHCRCRVLIELAVSRCVEKNFPRLFDQTPGYRATRHQTRDDDNILLFIIIMLLLLYWRDIIYIIIMYIMCIAYCHAKTTIYARWQKDVERV